MGKIYRADQVRGTGERSPAQPSLLQRALPLAVYAIIALFIMKPLLPPGYFLTLDMSFGPSSFAGFQFGDLYGTAASAYGAYLPFKLAMAALSSYLPIEIVEKLLLFSILVLCGAGIHYSLPEEHGAARYVAGLIYMLNPFVFIRFLAGHWSLLLSYAIWPLAVSAFLAFLDRPKSGKRLTDVALLTTVCAVSSHGVIMLLCIFALIYASRLIVWLRDRNRVKELLYRSAVLASLTLVLNLYWIVPTLVLSRNEYDLASPADYLTQFGAQGHGMPLDLAVLTMHGFWKDGFYYTKDIIGYWYVPFIIIAALALYGALRLLRLDAPLVCALLAAFAIAFLLALGSQGPLSFVYSIGGKLLPLYQMFRDTQKFVGVLCLAYAWFGSYGAAGLLGFLKRKASWFPQMIALAILLLAPLVSGYAFFGFLGQIGSTQYPSDWVQAGQVVAADGALSNILLLPPQMYPWMPWVNDTQKIVGEPGMDFFSMPSISSSSIQTRLIESDINSTWDSYFSFLFSKRQWENDTGELLLPMDVRYILLLKSDPDYLNYVYMFDRDSGPVSGIDVVYEDSQLTLYRNRLERGPFMATSDDGSGGFGAMEEAAGKGVYSPNVSFVSLGPDSFMVTGSALRYVVFTSPDWMLYDANGSSLSSWHNLGGYFEFIGPVVVRDSFTQVAIGLFLLSWLAALLALLRLKPVFALFLVIPFVSMYWLLISGLIGPQALGIILSATLLAALAIRLHERPRLRTRT